MFGMCDRLLVKIEREEDDCLVDDPTPSQSIKVKRESEEPIEGTKNDQSKKFKCDEPYCKYVTDSGSKLKKHKVIHSKKKHKCDKCGHSFKSGRGLKNHLKLHSKKTPFQCDICDKVFKVKQSLSSHKLKHATSEKWLKCEQCDYSTPYKSHFEKHEVVHTNAKPIRCGLCESSFKNKEGLKSHINNIHSESNCLYKCRKCDYSTKIKRYMQPHMLSRHGEKKHKCPQCDYSTAQLSCLKIHAVAIHTSEKPIECELCGKFFKTLLRLRHHINWKHSDRKFKCKECDYATATNVCLRLHMIRHTERKLLQCDECDFSCLQKKTFEMHVQKHAGQLDPLKCDLCDKVYFGKRRLYMHKRKVHYTKELKCTQCDYRTRYSDILKRHLLIHSGKELNCEQCDYTSFFVKQLDLHRLSKHSAMKKWRCDFSGCRYTTSAKNYLYSHTLYSHKLEKCVKCDQCDRKFKTPRDMKRHASTHTKNKPFKCDKCKFSSCTKPYLRFHTLSKHANEKKHKCEECGNSYDLVEDLKEHKLNHDKIKNVKCHLCPFLTSNKTYLTNHITSRHSSRGKKYKCDECDRSFSTLGILKSHQFVHSEAKIYGCYLCEYRTNNPRYLRQHKFLKHPVSNASNGEKCGQCGLTLLGQLDSKVHRDAHRPCFVSIRRDVNTPLLIHVKIELNEDIKEEKY